VVHWHQHFATLLHDLVAKQFKLHQLCFLKSAEFGVNSSVLARAEYRASSARPSSSWRVKLTSWLSSLSERAIESARLGSFSSRARAENTHIYNQFLVNFKLISQ
jgi:hypothetical protein